MAKYLIEEGAKVRIYDPKVEPSQVFRWVDIKIIWSPLICYLPIEEVHPFIAGHICFTYIYSTELLTKVNSRAWTIRSAADTIQTMPIRYVIKNSGFQQQSECFWLIYTVNPTNTSAKVK